MKNNQSGFGVLGIIAVIVVITGMGFAGWYVLHKNITQESKNTQATSGNQKKSSTTPSESEKPQASEADTVALSSWGLTFIAPASLQDLILTEDVNEAGEPFIVFSTQALKNLEANTYCDLLGASRKEAPYHLGILFKLDGSNVEGVDGKKVVKQYADYAIVYRKPADNCFTDNANQARSDQLMNELYASLKETISED